MKISTKINTMLVALVMGCVIQLQANSDQISNQTTLFSQENANYYLGQAASGMQYYAKAVARQAAPYVLPIAKGAARGVTEIPVAVFNHVYDWSLLKRDSIDFAKQTIAYNAGYVAGMLYFLYRVHRLIKPILSCCGCGGRVQPRDLPANDGQAIRFDRN